MKRFAQIEYGKAHWVFEAEEKPEFAPNIVLVDITDRPEIQEGWSYDEATGEFTPPKPSTLHVWDGNKWVIDIEQLKAKKIAELADARWREETGGYIYNGHEFHSDRESQDRVFQAYMASLSDPNFTVTWKTKTGWLEMTASDFIALYNEFQTFLQGLYQKEKNLQALVEAATTIDELNEIEW